MDKDYLVILFYKYINIPDPQKIRLEQLKVCGKFNLKGRIIVAEEGINGTVEGTLEDTEKYIKSMHQSPLFSDLVFKKSLGTGESFPKLSVKVRPEIVAAKMPQISPNKITGKYLSAEELFKWLEEKKEIYIVDMRNDYEYQSGYFEGSILSGIHNFYDLPNALPKLEHLKGKVVVTVCTGGVRCEKASGFLIQNGFRDVYQLEGGIQTFMEKYPNKYFKGKLYVFDNRLTIGVNVVGNCMHCNISCDNYVNCAYDFCHYHYICCSNCLDKETNLAFCKLECKEKYLNNLNKRLQTVPVMN